MNDQELRDTIKAAQGGDQKARNAVIVASRDMVRTIATKFAKSVGREDLIEDMCQQAIFGRTGKGGIVRAIEKYRTSGNETFSTYAAFWILLECRDMILPSTITPDQYKTRNRNRKKGAQQERAIAAGEVFEDSVSDMVYRVHDPQDERGLNEDYDILDPEPASAHEEGIAEMIDTDERRSRFMAALDDLELEERYVIRALCGLHGSAATHQQIADQMGIHRLKVHKIVKRAIKKLREHPLCRLTETL